MGRLYVTSFTAVSVSAAQDLFEIKCASTKALILHEIKITQYSDEGDSQAEGLGFILKRFAGSYTSGSGGSTHTPVPLNSGDTAASATVEINNTTQAAAGSGTLTTLIPVGEHIQNGWHYLPTPESRPTAAATEGFVVSITAPADALTMSGYAVVEEL